MRRRSEPALFAAVVVAIAVAAPTLPSSAAAASRRKRKSEAQQVVPEKKTRKQKRQERRDADMSKGGQRRGAIEYSLGGASMGLAAVLIGRGIWETVRFTRLNRDCASGTSEDMNCSFADPGRPGKVAAGLSFSLAVPFIVAGAFAFARAVRIQRDYRKWKAGGFEDKDKISVAPVVGRRGAGLAFRLRF